MDFLFCFSFSLESCSNEIILFDWIFDVQWLVEKKETLSTLAIVTAHNCLTILNVTDKTLMKTVSCAENCILYPFKNVLYLLTES